MPCTEAARLTAHNMDLTLRKASCTRASLKPISTHCCTMAGSSASSARCAARLAAAGRGLVSSVHFLSMSVTMPLLAMPEEAMWGLVQIGSTASRMVACTRHTEGVTLISGKYHASWCTLLVATTHFVWLQASESWRPPSMTYFVNKMSKVVLQSSQGPQNKFDCCCQAAQKHAGHC